MQDPSYKYTVNSRQQQQQQTHTHNKKYLVDFITWWQLHLVVDCNNSEELDRIDICGPTLLLHWRERKKSTKLEGKKW